MPTPKKKRPEIDISQKENFNNSFDLVFPKKKEVYQSIHIYREEKNEFSPQKRRPNQESPGTILPGNILNSSAALYFILSQLI